MGFLWSYIQAHPDFVDRAFDSLKLLMSFGWLLLVGVLLLMCFNWLLESKKWHLLVSRVAPISFLIALESVLLGLVFGVFVPRSVGYPFGRIYRLPVTNKWRLIGASLFNSTVQLLVTLFFGLVGLAMVLISELDLDILYGWSTGLSVGLLAVLVALIVYRRTLIRILSGVSPKLTSFMEVVNDYSAVEIGKLVVLSVLRYFVFTVQLLMVLYCFHHEMDWVQMFGLVSVLYLFKTIIPSPNAVVDLGVRQFSGMVLLEMGGVGSADAFTSTLVIWWVNLLLPSVVGLVLLWRK